MSAILLLSVVGWPLALAILVAWPGRPGRLACAAAPWAAVPGLAASVLLRDSAPVDLPWLLLGATVDLDATSRVFLLFTAFLWTAAGLHARAYVTARRGQYFFFHLLTLAGNLGLVIAHDLVSFYCSFALMTFSAYGLVVHEGTRDAYRAGRIYAVMAVLGEACLLSAFLLAAAEAPSLGLADIRAAAAGSAHRDPIVGLLLAGFGIKAGAVPLHVWLPLAHPVAPTPASAVLSGCMIKAGLLGWIRFLPIGEAAMPGWGHIVIALGLAAAFFGVAVGLMQSNPKTILAYSSISQMGIINVAVGTALADPRAAAVALPAMTLYALHHGLAKGSLFLGTSVASGGTRNRLVFAGMLIPALALAGAPLTSGALAKIAMEAAGANAPGVWSAWLPQVLPWAAVGTSLLMIRLFAVLPAAGGHTPTPRLRGPWLLTVIGSAVLPWVVPSAADVQVDRGLVLAPYKLLSATWPVIAALGAASAAIRVWRSARPPRRFEMVPGDLLIPLEAAWRRVRGGPFADVPVAGVAGPPDAVAALAPAWYEPAAARSVARTSAVEYALLRSETAVILTVLLVAVVWLLT